MTVLYAVISILSWRRLTVNSWDNAIFEQAIKAYAHFEAPIVHIKGGEYNILGDHFSPIYAVIAPFYRIFPYAQTLLIAQAVLIGIGIFVIARLAISQLGEVMGIAVSLLAGVAFGYGSAAVVDFHEVAFAVPFLALAGAAFIEGRFTATVWWSVPLLFVKEDMGVTVAAIGLAIFMAGQRKLGAIVGAGGLLATVLTIYVIIPAFNTSGGYDYTGNLGGNGSIPETILTQPDVKLVTLLVTFGITGFAALLSPWAVVAAPTFIWRFAGDVEYYWGTTWHYSMVLMPVVFVAMIDALSRRRWMQWPAVAVGAAFTGYSLAGGPLLALLDNDTWEPSPRAAALKEAIGLIPENAKVETDIGTLKFTVSDHDEVYWTGTIGNVIPDYILLDRNVTTQDPLELGARHGVQYVVIFDDQGYVVAQRQR